MRFGRDRRAYGKSRKLKESEEEVEKANEAGAPGEAGEADAAGASDAAGEAGAACCGTSETASEPAAPAKPAEPDWKDLYARLLADFDNFKKRTARDREETYRYAEADILGDVLPAIDNIALALSAAKDADDSFVKGIRLAYDSFLGALKGHGAEPFDSVGAPLDTERMEAVAQLPDAKFAEGVVSHEVKRGWMLKGKVLRAAQVVVSAGSPTAAPAAENAEPPAAENPAETAPASATEASVVEASQGEAGPAEKKEAQG